MADTSNEAWAVTWDDTAARLSELTVVMSTMRLGTSGPHVSYPQIVTSSGSSATATAAATATWSRCPSPGHGAKIAEARVSATCSTTLAANSLTRACTSPSGRPRKWGSARPKTRHADDASLRRRRPTSARVRPVPGVRLPSVTNRTRTEAPPCAKSAVVPPQPNDSSSGWGASTRTLFSEGVPTSGPPVTMEDAARNIPPASDPAGGSHRITARSRTAGSLTGQE